MTIKQKLDEKTKCLDVLEEVLNEWIEIYKNGTNFPDHPDMNINTFKLERIKEVVTEMLEVAEHIQILEEVIEESETL